MSQAGGRTIQVNSSQLTLPRQTADPTAAWYAELAAITPSEPTYDGLVLSPKKVAVIVETSSELLQDSAPNLDASLRNTMAQTIAQEIDRAALVGSGTGSEPQGIKDQTGVGKITPSANGDAPSYDLWLDGMELLRTANTTGSLSSIAHPRVMTDLAKLRDAQSQYLMPPPAYSEWQTLTASKLPINETQGTATDASTVFMGAFDQFLFAVGMGLEILTSRVANGGVNYFTQDAVGFRAIVRIDFGLERPASFVEAPGIVAGP